MTTPKISTITRDSLSRIIERVACPKCTAPLSPKEEILECTSCHTTYPIYGEVLDLRPNPLERTSYENDWTYYWSRKHQKNIAQRFFSYYRKMVFSRTVGYYVNRHFPEKGIFLEAGSGSSETSIRIDKNGGHRVLVALDIVLAIVQKSHPIMDVNLCGDIFQLPFHNDSVDGIWNVGVLEHFDQHEIDQIMQEFHRVLRKGATLIVLWPGKDAIPQKLIYLTEKMIKIIRRGNGYRFHPEEITQLSSYKDGLDVFARNNFQILDIDHGWRSLMAFKTIVGIKP